MIKLIDWAWFKSPPTQYRLYRRRFIQVTRPNQQYQSTEGNATMLQTAGVDESSL